MADIYFCREKKEKNYTTLDNTFIKDKRLSWKAKGIMTYLLSLPDDWKLSFEEVKNHASDGKTASRSAINELIQFGYIEFKRKRNEKGIFEQGVYKIIEHPNSNASNLGNPHEDNPRMEKPDVDNQTLLSTNNNQILNLPSTNSTNSENSSLHSEFSSQEQPQPQKDKNTKESNIHPLAKKQNITKTNNITDSQEKIQTNKNSDAQNLPAAKRSRPKVPLPDYEEVKDIEAILLKDGTEWRPDIFFIQEMTRLHPQVDVKAEFMAMRGWCVSNPTKRKTWAGVKRFVSGWLDRAQKKIQSAGANPYGGRNYYSKPHEGFKDGQRDYSNTADW